MDKSLLEKLINNAVDTGADYCDLFYEDTYIKKIILNDSKIDKIENTFIKGLGIRLVDNDKVYYTDTNDLEINNLECIINELKSNINKPKINNKINLNTIINENYEIKKSNNSITYDFKKEYLKNIDNIVRKYDDRIIQVNAIFSEYDQVATIANSKEKYVNTNRSLTRLVVILIASDGINKVNSHYVKGSNNGYEFLDNIDIEKEINILCESTINKLSAKPAPSGTLPVIVGGGFGVLIHEAVGHSLEATTVAKKIGVLSNKIGQKVAADIVTVVDDGKINNSWGSILIDDEGNYPNKNICIENGILKGYLVDEVNGIKMNTNPTGSGRRENYHYITTSRMTNTNLLVGKSTVDEMIKSIEYGLYAKVMGGGSVDPITGDFNFSVEDAYIIKNGKLDHMVKGASLIGNTLDVMNNIEMICNDFDSATGYCGSESGFVPVTCGQPTIKISSILVGGSSND